MHTLGATTPTDLYDLLQLSTALYRLQKGLTVYKWVSYKEHMPLDDSLKSPTVYKETTVAATKKPTGKLVGCSSTPLPKIDTLFEELLKAVVTPVKKGSQGTIAT